jgi:hypothetical protein
VTWLGELRNFSPATKMQKKVSKSVEISRQLPVHLFNICQAKKNVCRPTTEIWFIGLEIILGETSSPIGVKLWK